MSTKRLDPIRNPKGKLRQFSVTRTKLRDAISEYRPHNIETKQPERRESLFIYNWIKLQFLNNN